MKLTGIKIDNLRGARSVAMTLTKPVTLVCGRNEAGKTSIAEAVVLALSCALPRSLLKKQAAELVSTGAKLASVSVAANAGGTMETEFSATIRASGAMKCDGWAAGPALPYVLDAQRMAGLQVDERRAFLFGLMGAPYNTEAVKAMILRRAGSSPAACAAVAAAVAAMKPGGFPAGERAAVEKAAQYRAEWRAITGEAYGAQKAEDWRPAHVDEPKEEHVDAARRGLATLVAAQETEREALGQARQVLQRVTTIRSDIESLTVASQRLSRAKTKLGADTASLAEWVERVRDLEARAGSAPKVGLVHDLARACALLVGIAGDSAGVAGYHMNGSVAEWGEFAGMDEARGALATYEQTHGKIGAAGDPVALAALPAARSSLQMMQRSIEASTRDHDGAVEAGRRLAHAEAELAKVGEVPSITAASERAAAADRAVEAQRKTLDGLLSAQGAARSAEATERKAREAHGLVTLWVSIAEALAPSGIPAELLASALDPLNRALAAGAEFAQWDRVEVLADMTIRSALMGTPYALMSESQQWRADAMIAACVAELSGVKLLILDRFDVLDVESRGDCLYWLDELVRAGRIDSVLLLGTLKAKPAAEALPENVEAFWIEGGVVAAQEAAR